MKTSKYNDEVLFSNNYIVEVDSFDIENLKEKASQNQRKRIRLCTHLDHDDRIHEMLIIHEKSCYVRPHKHIGKIESFHIIEGQADVILFDEDGNIKKVISMGDYSTGLKFYYRMPPNNYHTLLIKSDVLIFHEVTNGPFRSEDTIFAKWAPEETEGNAVIKYLDILKKSTMII